MATTALIVEILVIGFFCLIWIALLVFKFYDLEVALLSEWLLKYKDWSTALILAFIAIAYQLGWSMNSFSYFIAKKTFYRLITPKIFKDEVKNYEAIVTMVFMNSAPFLLEKLREELGVVRLTRSAFVNFLLIAVMLFTLDKWSWGFGALIISLICLTEAYDIYSSYCNRIFNVYKGINENKKTRTEQTAALTAHPADKKTVA